METPKLNFRLDSATQDRFKQWCEEHRFTISEGLRHLVKAGLDYEIEIKRHTRKKATTDV